MKRFVFIVTFLSFLINLKAQPKFERSDSVPVLYFGSKLNNAWAGGLNFTEWNQIDLNGDNKKDLVVFDKSGEVIRCFLNQGGFNEISYSYSPQFDTIFPSNLNSWMLLYDYNADGKPDLFTYAVGLGGISVFKNTGETGKAKFTLAKAYLKSDYNPDGLPLLTNTPSSAIALPGLADLDRDGDMDIVCFQSSGIQFEFHKNMSIERYGNLDSLEFDMVDACWGNAIENNCTSILNYPSCPLLKNYQNSTSKESRTLHAGSCLSCIDMDGDLDMDLVLGDISCDSVEFFRNGGTINDSHFDFSTKTFPNNQHPINYHQFPCTYFMDINNDNQIDLISSPNITTSENTSSVWYFQNNGTNKLRDYQLIKKNFLQEQMLDFGEGAYPTAVDIDADGDLDLLVGNFGYYQPVSLYATRLILIENTGNADQPIFNVKDLDYLNLSSYNLKNIAPTVGDADGDGDADLFIGDNAGKITGFKNTAGIGKAVLFEFWSDYQTGILKGIDVGNNAYPQLTDVNKDGLTDLLVGEYDGTLNYLQNIGEKENPFYGSAISNFGKLKVNRPGYYEAQSIPQLINYQNSSKLFVGSDRGYLYLYGNIDGNLNGAFTLIDSIYPGIKSGKQLAPLIADFNNDQIPDLITGNYSGGLNFYFGKKTANHLEYLENIDADWTVYPNPTTDVIQIRFNGSTNSEKEITIMDSMGRSLMSYKQKDHFQQLRLESFENGLYLINVKFNLPNGAQFNSVKKIVKLST